MPKNTAAKKSKLRSRSTRKPLRDVSNGRISVSSGGLKKISGEGGGEKGSDSFDRILLVHSDISSLLRQIDELVVQAFQTKSNEGWKEIKEFANMLSDMQTTLKSWVPKFQKALAGQQPARSDEHKPDQPFEQTAVCVPKESNDNSIQSPEPTKWESLLSPSPLISWRAECNIEGGRQLFLLTPLPQPKSFLSKLQPTSVDARRMTTSEETAYRVSLSLLTTMPNKGVDLAESESTKSPANPEPINRSVFVMTPCLKMSPPKSCILLEPVSTFSKKKKQDIPLAAVVHNPDSLEPESSSSQSSGNLNVKYPELLGINMNKLGNKVADEESPA